MVNKAVIDAIKHEIEKIKDEFNYPNLGHAFVHFVIKLIFDLEDEEVADYCSIGTFGHDHGIDAIVDKDDALYIAQGKYTGKASKKFKRAELTDLQSAITFLSSPTQNIRKEVQRAVYLYKNYKESGKKIKLLLLFFGSLAKSGKEYIESFKNELPTNHDLEEWDIDKLAESFIQTSGIF